MNYVVHFCKNPMCNNCWIDKDLTNVRSFPPRWKYCTECVNKGYINSDKPVLTETQKTKIKAMNKAKKKNV